MNVLVLGDGPEELAWAQALAGDPEHRLWAACPGFKAFPGLPGSLDLDDALATAGVEAVIAGGGPELRAEGLRRAAAAGLPVLVLHPPGPSADPYYQVALSRQETGAVVVPDLPLRLHPALAALREAIAERSLGTFRSVRFESPASSTEGHLVHEVFPRVVDVVRALLNEVEAVTATGDPHSEAAPQTLLVVARVPENRRAEVRLWIGQPEPARLILAGERGSLTFEFDPSFDGPAYLVRKVPPEPETRTELDPWDPKAAMLDLFTDAAGGAEVHPDLLDATRTLELAGAVAQSLTRGRTIDLHYEDISETSNFKTVMTSTGCVLLLCTLVVLPLALVGPVFGLVWTLYLAYAIPPILVLFMLLQMFRFALRKES